MAKPFSLDESPATVEEVAAELIEAMPEVSEQVVASVTPEASVSASVSGEVDAAGETWDPAKHATRDGAGVKTQQGFWRRRKGLGGVAPRRSSVARPGVPATLQTQAQTEAKGRAAGVTAANALVMLGVVVGGEEWYPVTSAGQRRAPLEFDEQANLERAFSDYFIATGRTDFPPGVALSIAVTGYVLPRLTLPKTRERLGGVREWFAVRWMRWRDGRKASKAAAKESKKGETDGPRFDTRNDAQRQDDSRMPTGAGSETRGLKHPRT